MYILPLRFNIELCRPFGAFVIGDSPFRRGEPLRCFMSPLRGYRLIKNLSQLVYHYHNFGGLCLLNSPKNKQYFIRQTHTNTILSCSTFFTKGEKEKCFQSLRV